MLTRVQKWGNSLALRIPKVFAFDAQLENDSFVEITIVERQIIITPSHPDNALPYLIFRYQL